MLKRVSIQNFKSLKDVTLDLQKVNLLIGPNNSGKTNFLKALEFMGSRNTANKKTIVIPHAIKFKIEDDNIEYPPIVSIRLNFSPSLFSQREKYIALLSTIYDGYQLRSWTDDIDEEAVIKSLNRADQTMGFFAEPELDNLLIYKIDSNKLLESYPLLPDNDSVNADASNLVAYLDAIRDKYPDTFTSIQKGITACLPEFNQIRFDNINPTESQKKVYGDKTYKILGLHQKNTKTTFWSYELSEGVLCFLALICIINQPNPPKLLLLEEPEKGIHPRRIEEVINFIFGLVDDKDIQVIMTTHSPAVVDMFKDMPESVFIFDKDEEGATHVKNLQKDIIEPETKESERLGIDPPQYLNGLGEAWKVGFIGGVPR